MTSAVIGALRVTLGLDSAAFEGGLDAAQRQLRRAGQQMQRVGQSMQRVGTRLTIGLTAPIAAFGFTTLRAAGDFEQAMNRVQAVSGATADEFEALRLQARELGATTQFTASDAADAMGFLSMAGMEATTILAAMPHTLRLAASAQLDMGRAADIVTNIMAGYGLEVEELARANDVLVKAFTSANTDLSQLAEAMKYAGPVASAAGVQFEEAAAALSLMGNAGIQGSMAGTSLRGAISRILNPTRAMADAMAAAGVNFKDAQGRLLPLVDIIRQLEPHAQDAGLFMTLFGQRAGPAMAALVSQGADAVAGLTHELENSGGTAEEIAAVQMRGFNGAMRELKSAFEELQLAIADSGLIDLLADAALWLGNVIRSIAAANPRFLAIGAAIAAVAAALGPLLVAFGFMVTGIGALLPVIGAVGAALAALPLAPIIASVAALTIGFLAFKDDIIPAVQSFGRAVAAELGPKLRPLLDAVMGAVRALGDVFSAIFGGSGSAGTDLTTFGQIVGRVFGAALNIITGAINVVTNILQAFGALLRGDFSAMWGYLGDAVMSAVRGITNAFTTLFPNVSDLVRRTYQAVRDWLLGRFTALVEGIGRQVERVTGFFARMYDRVVGNSYVPDMVEAIAEWMGPRLQAAMVDPARQAADDTASAFSDLSTSIEGQLEGLFQSIRSKDWKGALGGIFDILGGQGGKLGTFGKIGSAIFKAFPGFQTGGSFTVGGAGAADSQLVAFRASPGERVDISTRSQQRQTGGGVAVIRIDKSRYFDAEVLKAAAPAVAASEYRLRSDMPGIAVGAVANARSRRFI